MDRGTPVNLRKL